MNVDIFIPARLDSERLPKKHLKELNGEPTIKILVKRLEKSKLIRNVIVCTTDQKTDDELVEFLKKENILVFRGEKKDIIHRFLKTAEYFQTDIIIDVEGDKIYTDTKYVDHIANELENSDYEFITGSSSKDNFDPSSIIHGFIPAGIKVSALKKIFQLKKTDDTETGYKEFFTSNPIIKKKFITIENIKLPTHSRFAIDYLEDYNFAKNIFAKLGNFFHIKDVVDLLEEQPELIDNLQGIIKKWEQDYEKNMTNISLNKRD